MSYSTYLEQNLLDHVFAGNAYAVPSLYVALFTDMPNAGGTAGTEVSGGAYARQSIDFESATGSTPASTQNTAQIEFPIATNNWGTIVGVGLYDAASGGNMLLAASLTNPKTITSQDQLVIPDGDFDISLD